MKFLLVAVNAKYIHSNPAIYSLRACVGEGLKESVEPVEYTINQAMEEILADIYRRKPDVVGFSCYIWNWRLVQELLEELPKLLPDIDLWLGGPEVSHAPEKVLEEHPFVTGIMLGEGEATFKELLEYYAGMDSLPEVALDRKQAAGTVPEAASGRSAHKSLGEIGGLCLPGGLTAGREPVDMSGIPFPYQDLDAFENKIIYYESSRGCPFRCSYCLSSIEKHVRLRDISVVERELQYFLDHRVAQVKFVDRTFNCDHSHATRVWRYLLEHDNEVTNFHFEIAADLLGEEELALLERMRPGLIQLEIGVQTANPQTLAAVRRRQDMEVLEKAVAALRQGGNIHLHLDLIAGLPYEDYESFGKSFDKVYRMKPHQLQLGFLKVLKGSEMWERAEEYGIRFMGRPPYEVLCTRWLSYEDLRRLKAIEEMVEVYYNSGQFSHTMAFLEGAFSGPFAMYEALADYFEKSGFTLQHPARARRFQLLLDFAREQDGHREAVYRELLLYDMYLRENLKSRPDFAPDLSPYRETIQEFYKKEQGTRRFLPRYGHYDWKQLSRMTHLEPFFYPVWDEEKLAEKGDQKIFSQSAPGRKVHFVLFDYGKRSPVDFEAFSQVVEENGTARKGGEHAHSICGG